MLSCILTNVVIRSRCGTDVSGVSTCGLITAGVEEHSKAPLVFFTFSIITKLLEPKSGLMVL